MSVIQPSNRVMIVCLVDEIAMIVQSAKMLKIDRIHVINYVRRADGDPIKVPREKYYQRFRDELLTELKEVGIEIVLHTKSRTYVFDEVMGTIMNIIREEQSKASIISVNISGGTSEYAAAAYVSSMMSKNVSLFSTGMMGDRDDDYYETLLNSKTINKKLVGSSNEVNNIFELTGFDINKPDLNLLKSLKIFQAMKKNTRTNTNVIRSLIKHGVWYATIDEDIPLKGTSIESSLLSKSEIFILKRKESVQYQRKYIDKWLELGWIDHDDTGRWYEVTKNGDSYLRIFCPDDVFKVNSCNLYGQSRLKQ